MINEKLLVDAKNYVNSILMPLENFYYHQYEHAIDVMQRAMYLWEKEWLNDDDIELLWLAWLFHDTGFTIQYDNNEYIWAKIARNYLKGRLYPDDKIDIIERIILATDPLYLQPKDIYESIIKDADLDNLWRDDFFDKWEKLKMELETIKKIKIKDPDWHHSSLDFLWNHKFYTKTQTLERGEMKKQNQEMLKKMIKWEWENIYKPNY